MDQATVAEALRQVWEGEDFQPPIKVLKPITQEQAAIKPENMPYSILTNLAHAEFWQRLWLCRLKDLKRPSITDDWRLLPAEHWKEIRADFLTGFQEAIKIAGSKPFAHKMKSEDVALKTLFQIALHNAYHMGQIRLLKRALRLEKLQSKSSRIEVNI